MKLLYCENCRDIVRPIVEPRFCMCGRHAIWAYGESREFVAVFDRQASGGIPSEPGAYIILLSNRLLDMKGPMRTTTSAALLADTDPNTWFGVSQSLVVRVRPGEHPRTCWRALPSP